MSGRAIVAVFCLTRRGNLLVQGGGRIDLAEQIFEACEAEPIEVRGIVGEWPLAEALLKAPVGGLILNSAYYSFSSVFFYSNRRALLLNGRVNNLVYGAAAPGAPPVFIDDAQFAKLWTEPQRWYLVAKDSTWPQFEKLVGNGSMNVVLRSGGKFLMTNHPF